MGRGLMPKEFDEGLLGMKPGEEKRIEFVIPLTSSNPDYVGKTAQFDVTLHELKARVMAPLDETFSAEMGFDTVEEMREDLRQRLSVQKAFQHDQAKEKAAREELAKRAPGDIPEPLVQGRRDSMMQDYARRLEQQGISLEAYANATGMTPEDFERNITRDAEEQIREDLALEALFRKLGLEVTDEDIDQEFEDMGSSADSSPADLRKKWEDMGLMPVIREGVVHRKAVGWLMENVEVVEKELVLATPEAADSGAESEAATGEAAAEGTKKPARKRAPKKAAPKAEETPAETETTEE